MTRIAVLYEDQLAHGNPRNFGPHVLVLACLEDRLQRPRDQLARHIDGHACKGIGNLVKRCREPILADRHARVLAVCDDDRVREHLRLASSACKAQVHAAIATGCAAQLRTILLVRNLETVLEATHHVLGLGPLVGKPSPLQRDPILLRLAYRGTIDQRQSLLQRVPSLAYLVAKLAGAVTELEL
jgi:hypothetical protein